MNINKPIFIVGIARSGTTILYDLFTKHKDTGYVERYSNKLHNKPNLFWLIPWMLKYQKIRYGINRPRPSEGWVWNEFAEPLEYLDETKVTEKIKQYYYKIIKTELKAFNANRFVSKNPRHCLRIPWLNAIFPDAKYILIWREPKAVINSNYTKIKEEWEMEFRFPFKNYKGHKTLVEQFGNGSKFDACVNFYQYQQDILNKDKMLVKDRLIEMKYSDLVTQPIEMFKKLYKFAELSWYDDLLEYIPKKLEQFNDEKWKKLPEKEKEILENTFGNSKEGKQIV